MVTALWQDRAHYDLKMIVIDHKGKAGSLKDPDRAGFGLRVRVDAEHLPAARQIIFHHRAIHAAQCPGNTGDPLGLGNNGFDLAQGFLVRIVQIVKEELGVADDYGERIVDFVVDTDGDFLDRFEFPCF